MAKLLSLTAEQQLSRTDRLAVRQRINDVLCTEYGYSENRIRQAWNAYADIERIGLRLNLERKQQQEQGR